MTTHPFPSKKAARGSAKSNGRAPSVNPRDVILNGEVRVPAWVIDLDSFRKWACSDEFPERGRFSFLDGALWVDLSMETDLHSQIKTVITIVVGSIVLNEALGRFYADRMLLTHVSAGLSVEPDAMFVSTKRLEQGLVTLKMGDKSMEVSGSPDMALEVVSKSSVAKDLVVSKALYEKAAVAEYWIVDSTVEAPELEIFHLVAGRYVAVRKRDGWVKSKVFGRSFRLTCRKDSRDLSQFHLETK